MALVFGKWLEETADTFKIKAATYGKAHWMDPGKVVGYRL